MRKKGKSLRYPQPNGIWMKSVGEKPKIRGTVVLILVGSQRNFDQYFVTDVTSKNNGFQKFHIRKTDSFHVSQNSNSKQIFKK